MIKQVKPQIRRVNDQTQSTNERHYCHTTNIFIAILLIYLIYL